MPEVVPIYRETTAGGDPEPFYVPQFQVVIGRRKLPAEVVNDVTQVTYKDKVDDLDSFTITVNNWDADRMRLKYEPPESRFRGLFDPGQRIELFMGYAHNMRPMLVGEITTVQLAFPEGGQPTLTLSGLNILHGFRKKQHTWSWEGRTDSQIAREIAENATSDDRPGLGLPRQGVEFLTPNAASEQAEPFVFMNNQFDIIFLLERARRKGYSISLELRRRRGQEQPARLVFGRPDWMREITYELEWGKTLCSFTPTLQTANQIDKVTVRGWNRQTKKPIEGTAEIKDLPSDVRINRDWQERIARAVNGRQEEIVSQPVRSVDEAKRMAKKILTKQRHGLITATGTTVGLPDMRAGRSVMILGFGARRTPKGIRIEETTSFDGKYYITETTHTINDQGYRTQFNARREEGVKRS